MNCREYAVDQILIKILVFAHLIDLLPLLVCHLFFDCLCCDIITIKIFTTKLDLNKKILLVTSSPLQFYQELHKLNLLIILINKIFFTLGFVACTLHARKASL